MTPEFLRSLADRIEAGTVEITDSELRNETENRPRGGRANHVLTGRSELTLRLQNVPAKGFLMADPREDAT